jgi:addiction module RelE/StbE family toxin
MKVVWSPIAIDRITEIAEYISSDNPKAADKWVRTIFTKVKRLARFPRSGRMVPESKRSDIREILYGNYRIIYRIRENQIAVLTVRHGKQILLQDEFRKQ